jgi:hypothetical protein
MTPASGHAARSRRSLIELIGIIALTLLVPLALRGIGCAAAFAAILILRSRTSLDFIYFQF